MREKITVQQVINDDYRSDKHYMESVRARMWQQFGKEMIKRFISTRFAIDLEFSEQIEDKQTTIKLIAWVKDD